MKKEKSKSKLDKNNDAETFPESLKFKQIDLMSLNETVRIISSDGETLQELSNQALKLFRKIKGS
jgi:hypothetical protein